MSDPRSTGAWRPLSAGEAPEPAKRSSTPLFPPDSPRPLASLVLLLCFLCAFVAQLLAGWPVFAGGSSNLPLPASPGVLERSIALGSLAAGRFAPLDALVDSLLHVDLANAVLVGMTLLLILPALEALRGHGVVLRILLLTVGLGQIAQQIAPFSAPGAAAAVLPLALTALLAATLRTNDVERARSQLRTLSAIAIFLGAFALLPLAYIRPAFTLGALLVGLGLGLLPRLPHRLDPLFGALGALLWTVGALLLLSRASAFEAELYERPDSGDFCDDEGLVKDLSSSPRGQLLTAQRAQVFRCSQRTIEHATALEASWPSVRHLDFWDNNVAWAMALVWADEPERLAEVEERAQAALERNNTFSVRHTLATVQVLRGHHEQASPTVFALVEEGESRHRSALLGLLQLERGEGEEARQTFGWIQEAESVEDSELVPILERRLIAAGLLTPPPDPPQ